MEGLGNGAGMITGDGSVAVESGNASRWFGRSEARRELCDVLVGQGAGRRLAIVLARGLGVTVETVECE